MTIEKTLYMSGRLRPGGVKVTRPSNLALAVSTAGNAVAVSLPMVPVCTVIPANSVELLLLAAGKNWASREPWKGSLVSPTLTIISSADGYAAVKVEYRIPLFPDWKRSTVKSSIDGSIAILDAPTGLSGSITDQGGTLLKQVWSDTVFATIRLPVAAGTDFIWIEHEYEFGGVVNSLATPLPPGTTTTTTTTTTASTTTTTAATTTTTAATTSTTSTTTTTTAPPEVWGWVLIDSSTASHTMYEISWYAWDFVAGSWQHVLHVTQYFFESTISPYTLVGSPPPVAGGVIGKPGSYPYNINEQQVILSVADQGIETRADEPYEPPTYGMGKYNYTVHTWFLSCRYEKWEYKRIS